MRVIVIVIFLNLLSSCMNPDPVYKYADGSGNLYTVSTDSIKYDPVRKEESSSGVYSGGNPKTASIEKAQYDSVQKILDQAIANTANHIHDRVMTSGAITVIEGGKSTSVVLKPGTSDIGEIEAMLKELLNNP